MLGLTQIRQISVTEQKHIIAGRRSTEWHRTLQGTEATAKENEPLLGVQVLT